MAIRLLLFAIVWITLFAVRLKQDLDTQLVLKVSIFASFLLLAIGILISLQFLARFRIPRLIELFLLPVFAGALIYAAGAIRHLISN